MYAHNLQHGIAIENTVRGVLGTPELLSECRLWPITRYGAAVAGGITGIWCIRLETMREQLGACSLLSVSGCVWGRHMRVLGLRRTSFLLWVVV